MESTARPPMISVSKSYHDTLETYVRHAGKLLGVVLIPQAITVLLSLAIQAAFFSSFSGFSRFSDILTLSNTRLDIALGLVVLMAVIQVIGFVALLYFVVHHEQTTMLGAFEHALGYVWRFIISGIVITLTAILGLVIGFIVVTALGVVIGRLSLDVFNALYNWLLLIPAGLSAAVSALFLFAPFSIIEQNHSVMTALGTSYRLVKPVFWPIVLRVILLYIVLFILAAVLQFIPIIGTIAALVVLLPLYIIYLFVLYSNLSTTQ